MTATSWQLIVTLAVLVAALAALVVFRGWRAHVKAVEELRVARTILSEAYALQRLVSDFGSLTVPSLAASLSERHGRRSLAEGVLEPQLRLMQDALVRLKGSMFEGSVLWGRETCDALVPVEGLFARLVADVGEYKVSENGHAGAPGDAEREARLACTLAGARDAAGKTFEDRFSAAVTVLEAVVRSRVR